MPEQIAKQAKRTIDTIRKPEARSEMSDKLLRWYFDYLHEVFSPANPSPAARKFIDGKGMVLIDGSMLRGSVTIGTRDTDSLTLYQGDSSPGRLQDLHPDNYSYLDYLRRKIDVGDTEVKKWLDSRVEFEKYYDASTKVSRGLKSRPNYEPSDVTLMHEDNISVSIQELTKIDETLVPRFESRDYPIRSLVVVLTTTKDLVYETHDGSLLELQRELVNNLLAFRELNPTAFQSLYTQLANSFRGMHHSTMYRYPNRDTTLIAEYYLKHSGYLLKTLDASEAIALLVRRKVGAEFIRQYHTGLIGVTDSDEKQRWKEVLIKDFIYSSMMNKDDMNAIIDSDFDSSAINNIQADFTQEQFEEYKQFEKRINLLLGFRQSIKFPSIDDFASIYLPGRDTDR